MISPADVCNSLEVLVSSGSNGSSGSDVEYSEIMISAVLAEGFHTTGKKDIRILNDVLLCMNPENTGKCMCVYMCICMCVCVCVVEDPMITRNICCASYHLVMERI